MRPQPMHLDGLPPVHVPFRFYLTAPVFGMAAAALLLFEPLAWTSRWTPATLAAVHLLTLGFISMVMVGSLFQVVPVLGGRSIARARTVAPWVHACLTAGTVLLSATLLRPELQLWLPALALLGVGFGVFALAAGAALAGGRGDSMLVVRLAVLAMLVTIALGAYLAVCRAWPQLHVGFRAWTDVHAAWGTAGWIALLVMGVSFQVIPMFQVAPAFGSRLARGTAAALFLGLVVLTFAQAGWLVAVAMAVVSGALITYAGHALSVLARRRRRRVDALNAFWRLSLVCLIVTAVLAWGVVSTPLRSTVSGASADVLLGVLAVFGFVLSVMFGMLLKIASFLAFLHLQRRCLADVTVADLLPTMNDFIGEGACRAQFRLHAVTVAAAVMAVVWPPARSPAAALLAFDFGYLMWNLTTAARRYRRASGRISAALAGGTSDPRGSGQSTTP